MAKQITIFTLPSCRSSLEATAWLSSKGIVYQEYSLEFVAVQQELRDLERRVKRRLENTPISVIGGRIYEGFDPEMFEEIIESGA